MSWYSWPLLRLPYNEIILPDPPMSWEPMETAPKDSTLILARSPDQLPIVVQWVEHYREWWTPEDGGDCGHAVHNLSHWVEIPEFDNSCSTDRT